MNKFLFTIIFFPLISFCQHNLKVNVDNVTNSTGHIRIAVYNNEEGFLIFDRVFKSLTGTAEKGITTVYLKDLPTGTYALAVFHDENSNEKLDTNFMGIPKEPTGFSIGKMKPFGPPSFKECSFKLDSNKEIFIHIK